MERASGSATYRCDLCRRVVDGETRERARHSWQPLIICERCVSDAEAPSRPGLTAAGAASL